MLKGEEKLSAKKYVKSLLAERKAASRQKKLEAKDFEKPAGERIKSGLTSFGSSLVEQRESAATTRKTKGKRHREPSVSDEISDVFSVFSSNEPRRKSKESSVNDIIPVFGGSSNYSNKKRASSSNNNLPYFANTGRSNYDFFFNNKKSRKPKSLLDL